MATETVLGGLADLDQDVYGNSLLGLTAAECKTREACLSREALTASRWASQDVRSWAWSQLGAPAPKRLKALAREGIPAHLRPALWLRFSGGLARQLAHGPGYYANLVHHPVLGRESPPLEVDARYADVWRTLHPGHLLLTRSASIGATQRLLSAYVVHSEGNVSDDELRHLGCIAAFLLAVMGWEHEEEAFFTLVALVEDRLPQTCVLQGEDSGVLEQKVLEALLTKRAPNLARSCSQLGLSCSELTEAWFPCLFAATLPAEATARVWDALLVEGPKVLFRVGLALFKINEAALRHHGIMAARQLQWRIARTYDVDLLMKVAFSGIGRLPMAAIARARLEQTSKQIPGQELPQGLIAARLGMHSRLAMLRASCEQLVQDRHSHSSSSSGTGSPRSP